MNEFGNKLHYKWSNNNNKNNRKQIQRNTLDTFSHGYVLEPLDTKTNIQTQYQIHNRKYNTIQRVNI